MALNFHQLHIFYTVSEKGSFSAAAAAMHMTQPAVTMQVQTLEEYFGTKLLNRSTKKIELTESGRMLLPFARRSIELMRETETEMARYTQKLEGRLQLGASNTIGEYVLPPLLVPFGRRHPDIAISLKVMNTTQILDEIARHTLNFGLVEAPVVHPDIISESVMHDELRLIVPAGHALAARASVTLEEASAYPFVLREEGSGTRQVMEDEWKAKGMDPRALNTVMELGSTGAVKSAVEAGLGITMLSPSSVKHELALGLLHVVPIEDASFKRQFYSVRLRSTLLPIAAVAFLNFLRDQQEAGTNPEGGARHE
ncbi:LysR family transcriptional regulator [Saccharibacillus sp. O23]|uniref:selenium metabolism-associated LysR family transcriptional regulator n=1 Tax=Saccharibacillus sp. O23 TaxID=2009338 RepID=UPI000B4E5A4B|nr:selenium metabolism-associated LysR family transcriptional regulator [Saccharibacillus sp. O23]OWR29639.1 LysR family transcriptional regulator [Saccharibacillus sp. O23]